MEKPIQTMAGHWLQLLIYALIVLMNTRVYGEGSAMVQITILDNALAKGAVCLDGTPAGYHYSRGFGDGSNNWLVYLPGGGWCPTAASCLDRVQTTPDIASTKHITRTYFGGILSPNQTYNPDFYNWNRAFIRYCDGSSFIGDVEAVDPETNLHYRGSRIFSAVVDELLELGLRNAQNVILAGNSAGGLATILNCDRFRTFVPNAPRVKCISDSGFFIRAKDLPNAGGRELNFAQVVELHGATKFLPSSCTSKMDPGLCFFPENLVGDIQTPLFLLNSAFDRYQISVNLRPYPANEPGWPSCTNDTKTCTPAQLRTMKECFFPENLVGDIQTPLFLLNSAFDRYQISVNLRPYPANEPGWPSCTNDTKTCTPAQLRTMKDHDVCMGCGFNCDFRNTFLETLNDVGDSPSNSRGMFINSCYLHDYISSSQRWNSDGSPRLDNKTIAHAIGDWYFDRKIVKLIDTQTDFPLNCDIHRN
ncbi:hypothetical protein OROMI_020238 [Orobanche minor]